MQGKRSEVFTFAPPTRIKIRIDYPVGKCGFFLSLPLHRVVQQQVFFFPVSFFLLLLLSGEVRSEKSVSISISISRSNDVVI